MRGYLPERHGQVHRTLDLAPVLGVAGDALCYKAPRWRRASALRGGRVLYDVGRRAKVGRMCVEVASMPGRAFAPPRLNPDIGETVGTS